MVTSKVDWVGFLNSRIELVREKASMIGVA